MPRVAGDPPLARAGRALLQASTACAPFPGTSFAGGSTTDPAADAAALASTTDVQVCGTQGKANITLPANTRRRCEVVSATLRVAFTGAGPDELFGLEFIGAAGTATPLLASCNPSATTQVAAFPFNASQVDLVAFNGGSNIVRAVAAATQSTRCVTVAWTQLVFGERGAPPSCVGTLQRSFLPCPPLPTTHPACLTNVTPPPLAPCDVRQCWPL